MLMMNEAKNGKVPQRLGSNPSNFTGMETKVSEGAQGLPLSQLTFQGFPTALNFKTTLWEGRGGSTLPRQDKKAERGKVTGLGYTEKSLSASRPQGGTGMMGVEPGG